MAARVWTRDELDRVHPLPGDWEWMRDGSRAGIPLWSAVIFDDDYGESEVASIISVDQEGRLSLVLGEDDTHTADVALAVVLVSKGRDSYEAMAAAMEQRDRDLCNAAIIESGEGDREAASVAAGEALGFRRSAAMLRRGTVPP